MRDSAFPGTNRAHSADETGDNPWGLVPDSLPHMDYEETSPGTVVRGNLPAVLEIEDRYGEASSSSVRPPFPAGPALIGPRSHVHVLLDRKALTTAYPQLTVSRRQGRERSG